MADVDSTAKVTHEFPFGYRSGTDPTSETNVTLMVVGPDPGWSDGTIGVAHGDCDRWADVSPDLDCFYCPKCGWNGRISGAWVTDMVESVVLAAHKPTPSAG